MTRVMLMPSEGFALCVDRGVDPQRFIEAFAEVWPRLPPGACHALIRAWYPLGPDFALVQNLRRGGKPVIALFQPLRTYRWSASELENIDSLLYPMLIAHEFGHGVLFAVEGNGGTEEAVEQLVRDWGFVR